MDKIKLKPCPFCGGKAIFRAISSGYNTNGGNGIGWTFDIECECCGVQLKKIGELRLSLGKNGELVVVEDERLSVAEEWNRRALDEPAD